MKIYRQKSLERLKTLKRLWLDSKYPIYFDEKWRGIAIRIEDNILVTQTGHENLSAEIPRTIKDIEEFMA